MSIIPWYTENICDESTILSSRIRLARNLKKYPFSQKLSNDDASHMLEEINHSVAHANDNNKKFFRLLDINSLSTAEQRVFLEKHIVSQEFLKEQQPKGLLISDNQNISVMINEEDHIRIQSIRAGESIEMAFETANQIDDLIEESLEYAFHDEYGYLTSCPTNTGTGLRASYMVHLPSLTMSDVIKDLLPYIQKMGITLRGIYGEGSAPLGSIYQISNQTTLGKSEAEIIESLTTITNYVIEQEKTALEKIISSQKNVLVDRIYRSYGILSNARLITTKEAMGFLSDIRLGYITGILDIPKKEKQIYQIMMEIQPGHLMRVIGEDLSGTERALKRANTLREIFKQ